jgi:hypothetical protein
MSDTASSPRTMRGWAMAVHDIVPFANAQEALGEVLIGHVRGKVVPGTT